MVVLEYAAVIEPWGDVKETPQLLLAHGGTHQHLQFGERLPAVSR